MRNKNIKARYTKGDISRINNAFYNKVEEYSKLSLDELKELYPILGGTYRIACLEVIEQKLQKQKENNLNEAIKDIKETIVEQETTTEDEENKH
jgi:hypothetical protein